MDTIIEGMTWYFAFLFSTVLHEAAHALAALKLGDPTAYHEGQVSLDPRPHIRREFVGAVVVPIVSFILCGWMFGWASAPYNREWERRYPHRAAWMSLAGPAANLTLVIIAAGFIRLGMLLGHFYPPDMIDYSHVAAANQPGIPAALASLVGIFFSLNLILFLFNLLPLPPLDGSGALSLLLSKTKAINYLNAIHNPAFNLIGIVVAWNIFGYIFDPIHTVCINLLYPGMGYH